MKQIPMRLGPLALLLMVISICMTVLGILTFTTARADLSMAEKYAQTVETRYLLESRGQSFLQEAYEDPEALLEEAEDGVYRKTLQEGELSLQIGLKIEGKSCQVVSWCFSRDWEADENMGGLWSGNETALR